jgi:hypothetical protein
MVKWNDGERFSDEPQLATRSPALILRSARAPQARQSRMGVRASRRMSTAPISGLPEIGRLSAQVGYSRLGCVRPHASRRIAAHSGCGSACARRAAMLLSMRATVRGAFWPNEASGRSTNLRLWESSAGSDPLFWVVLYNENCNPNVSSRQRVATAWGCRRVRSPPPTCRCRRRGELSTPRACWPWLRSQARRSAASPPASPRFRESPCSRAR